MSVINVIKSLCRSCCFSNFYNYYQFVIFDNSMVEFVIAFPKGIKFFLRDLEIRFTRNSIQICD